MAANLAIRLAVQWVAWVLSAGMTIFLLPFLLLFWAWSLLTDYSDTVKHKSESSTKGWRISRGWGNSRFVQLKVSNTIDIHLKNILFLLSVQSLRILFLPLYRALGCQPSLYRGRRPITTVDALPSRLPRILVLLASPAQRILIHSPVSIKQWTLPVKIPIDILRLFVKGPRTRRFIK